MKITEKISDEQFLPVDFLTSILAKCWEEAEKLETQLASLKKEFTNTTKVEPILQGLVDAYLICAGRLERLLDNKGYFEQPESPQDVEESDSKVDSFTKAAEEFESTDSKEEEPLSIAELNFYSKNDSNNPEALTGTVEFELVDFEDPELTQEDASVRAEWLARGQ